MEPLTIRIREETKQSLEGEASEYNVSVSEYIRELIDKGRDYDELEGELERVRREKRQLLEQRQEHTELVRYVEEEVEYREAPVWRRARWWLMGKA